MMQENWTIVGHEVAYLQPFEQKAKAKVMKTPALLSALVLLSIGSFAQAGDQTYNWVSSDANRDDISATITLDSPSSSAGTQSDFVSGLVTIPGVATYTLNQGDISDFFGPFTWKPNEITQMDLGFNGGFFPANYELMVLASVPGARPGSILDAVGVSGDPGTETDYRDSGAWKAVQGSVPDAGGSVWLLGLALTGLGGLRRLRR
jgi:hypothetical protein